MRDFVEAYERLKLEMDRLKKYGDELDFFARELQCRRVIDAKRKVAIQQAKTLSDCLSKIHTPDSADLEGPDWHLTKDEIAAVRDEGERAERDLEDRISAVGKSADDLDAAFRAGLEQLRSRIRRIDALVIHDKRLSD